MADPWDDDEPVSRASASDAPWEQDQPVQQRQARSADSDAPWERDQPAQQQQQQAQPEAEGVVGTAAREAAHGIVPMLGAVAGGAAGSIGGLPGIIAGSVAGGAGAQYLQEKALNLLGFDDSHQRAVNAKENPVSAIVGEIAPVLPYFGAGSVARAGAGLFERMAPRVVGGAAVGGMEGARQLYEGEFDPLRLAAQTATGAALVKPTALTKGIESRVGAAMGRAVISRPGFPAEGARETAAAREEVQPRGKSTPNEVTRGAAEEAPPPQEQKVGDVQNAAERSARDYPAEPRVTEPGAAEPGTPEARLMTPGEIATARSGVHVGEDPGISAALGGEHVMPAEDRAMLQQQQRGAAPEGAPERPAAPPVPPGLEALVARNPRMAEFLANRYPELETMQRQARGPEQFQQQENLGAALRAIKAREEGAPAQPQPELSPAARAFQARMAAQRAAQQGGTLSPTGGVPGGGGPGGPGGPAAVAPPPAGGVPPGALEPATRSDLQQGLLASLRRMFMPMLSESAQKAGAAIREAYGPLARLREQTAARFTNDMHTLGNSMDEPAFNKFVDAYETGRTGILPPEQKPLAKTLGQGYGDFWNEIKKMPFADKMEATKNFLTHMYDNSNGQIDKFTRDWYGAGGGSLRARTHPTFADARAAGLKQLSNNPIEYFARYSEAMSNHLAQRRMMADLEAQNRIGYFKPRAVGASGTPEPFVKGGPPEGYAEIKMPWAQKDGKQAYAPRDIAETINQFYDAGLRKGQAKNIYDFLQQTKNMWTAVELGLSAYHATTMAVESVASQMARTLQLAATGNYAAAAKNMMQFDPYSAYRYGRKLRQEYRDPTSTNPILNILAKANIQPGNLRVTGEYEMSRLGNFWDASKRGSLMNEFNEQLQQIRDSNGLKIPQIALDNIRRATQTISKPLFEHYIPELKLGTMAKDLEAWLHANPNATSEQATAAASRISDSIDNRMGEMNMNNLFMNKAAKQAAMLALRSFGFTVGGPGREIGAGLGAMARDITKGKSPLARLSLKGEHDPRAAYALAFLPTVGAIGAAYQYMRTGEPPDDLRDFVTPKTSGTVKSVGQQVPERALVPGYHKDFLGYFVNPAGPLHELHAKLAAPWSALEEQLTGKDWRDKPYVPPRASTLEWLAAHGRALGAHMLPIGPKQLAEGKKEGSALTLPEQVLGVRTPGAYMLNPKGLEGYLTKQQQRDWTAKEKQENRERQQRGQPPVPARRLPPGYVRGGPILQSVGERMRGQA